MQIASLRWQHQSTLGPPCRSGRRRFRGDLNLSRRFIRPHSPAIDFGSGLTFNPLLLHPPFFPLFFFSPLVSSSRLSDLRLFPFIRSFPFAVYYRHAILATRCPRKYRTCRLAFAKDVSKALPDCQTHQVRGRVKGLSPVRTKGLPAMELWRRERSSTKSLARVHSGGIAGAICFGRNSVI